MSVNKEATNNQERKMLKQNRSIQTTWTQLHTHTHTRTQTDTGIPRYSHRRVAGGWGNGKGRQLKWRIRLALISHTRQVQVRYCRGYFHHRRWQPTLQMHNISHNQTKTTFLLKSIILRLNSVSHQWNNNMTREWRERGKKGQINNIR